MAGRKLYSFCFFTHLAYYIFGDSSALEMCDSFLGEGVGRGFITNQFAKPHPSPPQGGNRARPMLFNILSACGVVLYMSLQQNSNYKYNCTICRQYLGLWA